MPITFKSQADADLVMVSAHAQALLQALGKSPEGPGILELPDMPAAVALLEGLSDEGPVLEGLDEEAREVLAEQFVSLKKRAWPLVQMIRRAQAEEVPVVWGV